MRFTSEGELLGEISLGLQVAKNTKREAEEMLAKARRQTYLSAIAQTRFKSDATLLDKLRAEAHRHAQPGNSSLTLAKLYVAFNASRIIQQTDAVQESLRRLEEKYGMPPPEHERYAFGADPATNQPHYFSTNPLLRAWERLSKRTV